MAARPSRKKKTARRTKRRAGTVTSLSELLATVRRHDSELTMLRRVASESAGRQQEIMDRLDRGDVRFQRIDSHLIETNNAVSRITAEVASLFDKAMELVMARVTTQVGTLSSQQAGIAQQLQLIRDILDKKHDRIVHDDTENELVSRPPHIPDPKKVDVPGNGR